jgi:hypothetical protein
MNDSVARLESELQRKSTQLQAERRRVTTLLKTAAAAAAVSVSCDDDEAANGKRRRRAFEVPAHVQALSFQLDAMVEQGLVRLLVICIDFFFFVDFFFPSTIDCIESITNVD